MINDKRRRAPSGAQTNHTTRSVRQSRGGRHDASAANPDDYATEAVRHRAAARPNMEPSPFLGLAYNIPAEHIAKWANTITEVYTKMEDQQAPKALLELRTGLREKLTEEAQQEPQRTVHQMAGRARRPRAVWNILRGEAKDTGNQGRSARRKGKPWRRSLGDRDRETRQAARAVRTQTGKRRRIRGKDPEDEQRGHWDDFKQVASACSSLTSGRGGATQVAGATHGHRHSSAGLDNPSTRGSDRPRRRPSTVGEPAGKQFWERGYGGHPTVSGPAAPGSSWGQPRGQPKPRTTSGLSVEKQTRTTWENCTSTHTTFSSEHSRVLSLHGQHANLWFLQGKLLRTDTPYTCVLNTYLRDMNVQHPASKVPETNS